MGVTDEDKKADVRLSLSIPQFPKYSKYPCKKDASLSIIKDKNGESVLQKCIDDVKGGKDVDQVMQGMNSIRRRLVDRSMFMKLFAMEVKEHLKLSKSATLLFHHVAINLKQDQIVIDLYPPHMVDVLSCSEKTYYNSLREMLSTGVLYKTTRDYYFYVNSKYIYNGDRLNIVKSYILDESGRYDLSSEEDMILSVSKGDVSNPPDEERAVEDIDFEE